MGRRYSRIVFHEYIIIIKLHQGKNLPFGATASAAVVPYQDTFVLVGGMTTKLYKNATDTVYKYVPSTDDWELMPTRLRVVIQ